jgi:hypothetical protein
MHTHYLKEIKDDLVYDDKVCLITTAAFEKLADYTRSQPTSPSPGRVYKKNLHWSGPPDNWFVYVCALDPEDSNYVLHHGRVAVLV